MGFEASNGSDFSRNISRFENQHIQFAWVFQAKVQERQASLVYPSKPVLKHARGLISFFLFSGLDTKGKIPFPSFRPQVLAGTKLSRVAGADPKYPDICFSGAGEDLTEVAKHFPTVSFQMEGWEGGTWSLELAPENFLFKHSNVKGAYCLGIFENQDAGSLIGGETRVLIWLGTSLPYSRCESRQQTSCFLSAGFDLDFHLKMEPCLQ